MGDVVYHAPPPFALLSVPLDPFTAVYHRRSGITHLLSEPAPQIIEALGADGLSLPALLDRLAQEYHLADADAALLRVRLDELVNIGLVTAT